MRFLVVLAMMSGCGFLDDSDGELCDGVVCPVTGPVPVTAPSNDVFVAVRDKATTTDTTGQMSIAIDMHACAYRRFSMAFGLGSGWLLVHPYSATYCQLWLGGESENPGYDGHPTQYCLFNRAHTLTIVTRSGPIRIEDQPACVSL